MENNYFLHTKSLNTSSYEGFEHGMGKLIEIKFKCEPNDHIYKHNNIYNLDHYLTLCCQGNECSTAILQYIEQSASYEYDIDEDNVFEREFPIYNTGFMGIDFSSITDIEKERQITDESSFINCKTNYHKKLLKISSDIDACYCLQWLFPKYKFERSCIDDILHWKKYNQDFLESIIDLLFDIECNPFTGGKGKTEVLKYESGMASKRIDGEHRVTYTLKNGGITIHRCRNHYE